MLSKKKIIFIFLWFFTILISIIWTFENSDQIQALKDILKNEEIDKNQDVNINSAYYSLNLKKFKVPVYSKYGGIEKINNKIYYLSGDLNFYQLKKNKDNKKYDFISLPIKKITNNKDKFLEKNNQILGKKAWKFFGAKDILIEKFKSFENKVLIIS